MDEMLRLIQQNNIKAADVDKVEVAGNLSNYRTLFQHHPVTGLQGKFSMEYAMAILLLERKATLSSFTDAVAQRPDMQDMIKRVRYYVDPAVTGKITKREEYVPASLSDVKLTPAEVAKLPDTVLTAVPGQVKGEIERYRVWTNLKPTDEVKEGEKKPAESALP